MLLCRPPKEFLGCKPQIFQSSSSNQELELPRAVITSQVNSVSNITSDILNQPTETSSLLTNVLPNQTTEENLVTPPAEIACSVQKGTEDTPTHDQPSVPEAVTRSTAESVGGLESNDRGVDQSENLTSKSESQQSFQACVSEKSMRNSDSLFTYAAADHSDNKQSATEPNCLAPSEGPLHKPVTEMFSPVQRPSRNKLENRPVTKKLGKQLGPIQQLHIEMKQYVQYSTWMEKMKVGRLPRAEEVLASLPTISVDDEFQKESAVPGDTLMGRGIQNLKSLVHKPSNKSSNSVLLKYRKLRKTKLEERDLHSKSQQGKEILANSRKVFRRKKSRSRYPVSEWDNDSASSEEGGRVRRGDPEPKVYGRSVANKTISDEKGGRKGQKVGKKRIELLDSDPDYTCPEIIAASDSSTEALEDEEIVKSDKSQNVKQKIRCTGSDWDCNSDSASEKKTAKTKSSVSGTKEYIFPKSCASGEEDATDKASRKETVTESEADELLTPSPTKIQQERSYMSKQTMNPDPAGSGVTSGSGLNQLTRKSSCAISGNLLLSWSYHGSSMG